MTGTWEQEDAVISYFETKYGMIRFIGDFKSPYIRKTVPEKPPSIPE